MTNNTDPVRALIGEMTEYLDQQVDPELDVIAKWRDRLEDALASAPPSVTVGVEGLVERMRQAPPRLWRADLVGQQISVERMRDILAFALAQQPAAPSGEAVAFAAVFLQSVASLCRAAYDLCQPKPQRTPEDPREHYGELCLLELVSVADEIERRLAAAEDGAKETDLWRCTVCGRVGAVGRCCGEETREPCREAAALAAQQQGGA